MCGVSESAQLVSEPEERHGAEGDGHHRQATSRHAEGLRHQLLQVLEELCLSFPLLAEINTPPPTDSSNIFPQAAQQGRQPPGDVQERLPRAAVASLPRANQAAAAEEAAGKRGPQPQSLSGFH